MPAWIDRFACEADNGSVAPLRDWLDRSLDPYHAAQHQPELPITRADGEDDDHIDPWDDEMVVDSRYSWEIAADNLGLSVSGHTFWEGLAKTIEGTIGGYHVRIRHELSRSEGGKSECTVLTVDLPSDVPFTSIARRVSLNRSAGWSPFGPNEIDEFKRRYKVRPDFDRFAVAGGLQVVSDLEDLLRSRVSIRNRRLKRRFAGRPSGRELERIVKAIVSAVDRVRPAA